MGQQGDYWSFQGPPPEEHLRDYHFSLSLLPVSSQPISSYLLTPLFQGLNLFDYHHHCHWDRYMLRRIHVVCYAIPRQYCITIFRSRFVRLFLLIKASLGGGVVGWEFVGKSVTDGVVVASVVTIIYGLGVLQGHKPKSPR